MSPTTQIESSVVESQVLDTIRELLKELGSEQAAQRLSLDSSIDRDLGLGSLERVELLVRCESRFGVRLPDEVAQEAETPADWARAVALGGAPATGAAEASTRYKIIPPEREAPPAPDTARSLAEVLRRHAEVEPDRVHIHLPEDDAGQDITYRELLGAATAVAAGLASGGLERDQTVAIMLPTCADFFFAFFGTILAGGIPVPIYPPARPDKIEEYVRRQTRILHNAEVRFLVTFDRVKAISRLMRLNLPSLVAATSVEELRRAGAGRPAPAGPPSETGFIQYTSGSTGDPKGVVLSHANILANIRGIGHSVKVQRDDVVVTWLPLYHDMGLIGSWLFSLYYGAPITVLSPLAFLSRPERWLWAMHDARGTLCPAPNFSYELCARKIPDRALEGLDLSAWRVAINAGEAVLPDTLARFTERFATYGFRPESWVPCYGLAESSVALAFPPIDRRPAIDTIRRVTFEEQGIAAQAQPDEQSAIRFVANGRPMPGHEIRIVDDKDRDVPERMRGRVIFRGPSRTAGYYRNPAATAAATVDGAWFDSGDLGYWAGGELYITGRKKDCIIKSGRNIIPQEVEEAAAGVAGVRRGCVAAFGVTDEESGTERLVVVAETRAARPDQLRQIEAEIVKAVDAVLGIPPDKVQLVAPQSIPKTSSGKIRRFETKALFETGQLHARKRPPWLQLLRLAGENIGSGLRLGWEGTARSIRAGWSAALLFSAAAATGAFARLLPGSPRVGRFFQTAASAFLGLSGHEFEVNGIGNIPGDKPAILVANHPGRLDVFVMAAAMPVPFLLAGADALAGLPRSVADLLLPLVVAEIGGETPPGGTPRQRIRKALEGGHSVLVFPEVSIGAPAHRARFRLDAFHAAVETASPIYPIGLLGTSHMLGGHPALRRKARIVIGEGIPAAVTDRREMVRLRDEVRDAITRNCE